MRGTGAVSRAGTVRGTGTMRSTGAVSRAGTVRGTGTMRSTGTVPRTGAGRGAGAVSSAGCGTARAGEIARARSRVLVPRSAGAVRVVVPRPPVHRNVTALARSVTPVVVGTVVVRHLCSSPMVGGRKTASPEQ
jgi:hypothetical protein